MTFGHTAAALCLGCVVLLLAGDHGAGPLRTELRVCSDPNNLPFSNSMREGFENRIVERVGQAMHVPVEYTWWAQRRGFVRNTINTYACDVVVGIPSSMEMLLATRPYYRSSYVFVSRQDRGLHVHSFDDSALKSLRIGVQLIGDDYANAPPAHALSARGLARNLVGFSVYGDYRGPNAAARIITAVVSGQIDLGVVWGPSAGFEAQRAGVPLEVVPVSPHIDLPYLPFVYDIAMGVRRGDTTLRAALDDVLVQQRPFIDSVLKAYGVPRLDFAAARTRQ